MFLWRKVACEYCYRKCICTVLVTLQLIIIWQNLLSFILIMNFQNWPNSSGISLAEMPYSPATVNDARNRQVTKHLDNISGITKKFYFESLLKIRDFCIFRQGEQRHCAVQGRRVHPLKKIKLWKNPWVPHSFEQALPQSVWPVAWKHFPSLASGCFERRQDVSTSFMKMEVMCIPTKPK